MSIEMSLDDIIKQNRTKVRGGGRQRGRGLSNLRGVQRGKIAKRGTSGVARNIAGRWQHDMFQGARTNVNTNVGVASSGIAKLSIANLDFGVNDADIKELFQEFGPMRRAAVHYDRSGRSLGTAEVVYINRASAVKAQSHYNGMPLDGRPMNIQLVGAAAVTAVVGGGGMSGGSALRRTGGGVAASSFSPRRGGMGGGRAAFSPRRGGGGNTRGRGTGTARGGRGGRGGGRKENKPVPTKDELDAELAAYNAQRS